MHKEEEEAAHYEQEELEALELMWGESFLSPGGPEEVAAVLAGLDLRGREVLDIGCGLGGVTALLVTAHGAAHVTALDVEPRMVAGTLATIRKAGLHERVTVVQSRPGPLPAHDASFDVVFSYVRRAVHALCASHTPLAMQQGQSYPYSRQGSHVS